MIRRLMAWAGAAHIALHLLVPVTLLADGWTHVATLGVCLVCWLKHRSKSHGD